MPVGFRDREKIAVERWATQCVGMSSIDDESQEAREDEFRHTTCQPDRGAHLRSGDLCQKGSLETIARSTAVISARNNQIATHDQSQVNTSNSQARAQKPTTTQRRKSCNRCCVMLRSELPIGSTRYRRTVLLDRCKDLLTEKRRIAELLLRGDPGFGLGRTIRLVPSQPMVKSDRQ